ncbi:MAG: NAD(P)/FAD-dependent oxidoreductase [Armatimonadota bacterium]
MDESLYDFTIIGGGPTGLFGAFYAGLRQMRTKVIDSLPQLGGQLAALYPEKYIYDVGGYPKVLAKELVERMSDQALQYAPTVCLDEKVLRLEPDGDQWVLTTDKGSHRSRTVLIAAGVGAFIPRKLDLPGIDALEGKGIHYFVSDPALLAGKRLVIVGGGDSAFDWSMALGPAAASCVQIHRTDKFRAHEDTVAKVLEAGKVEIRTFHELKALHGEDRLEAVTIFDNRSGEETTVPCDALLLNLGFLTNLGPIKEWGLEIDKNAIRVDPVMRTNLPGVYAAGDICTYTGKLKLIATGIGEAGTAANFAKTYIDPSSKAFPGHSSDMK